MRKLYQPLLFLILLFAGLRGEAQERRDTLVSGNFNELTFDQFVRQVEASTLFRFYYDAAQTDSLTVDLSVRGRPLAGVLDRIFRNTDLHYAVDGSGRVFITRGFTIRTALPEGFFRTGNDTAGLAAGKEPLAAHPLQTAQPGAENQPPAVAPENKLHEIGLKINNSVKEGKANIAGYVRNSKTGEALAGAILYAEDPAVKTVTDQFGYYSITLPKGRHTIGVKALGMNDTRRQVMLYSDGRLNIDLEERVLALKEVVIESEKAGNVNSTRMGETKLSISAIKQIPAILGETDILRAVLTLPGVQSVGEASTGFNVRGGATDQNLVLFNDATVYNPSHLFGFFSAFDPDVVKEVTLYKSSIPAKYGGRLSSVLDVTTLDGNAMKFTGSAGIGPLTSRLKLEGPLTKDKTSFILGMRSTYSDWLLKVIPDEYNKSKASFYDGMLHLTHKINDKNSVYLTGYLSSDRFNLNSDTTYGYRNKNANFKWKHIFNNRFYGVLTSGYDRYQYEVFSDKNPVNAYRLAFDINQYNLKADFSYFLNSGHTLDFGFSSIYYLLHPGSFLPRGKSSLIIPDRLQAERAVESAVYAGDHFTVGPRLSLDIGIRYSLYNYLAPETAFTYAPGLPEEEINILDTISYQRRKVIRTYQGPAYRVSVRYALSSTVSVKAAYNSLRQYIHMLSNTAAISPTDIWKLSDPHIRPQQGDQFSVGFYKNFKSNTIETSVELYYKRIENYLDYKSGATLIMNHHIETDVINTKEKAYGIELMIKKLTGKLNGWVSYTYSRALLRMDDPYAGELINHGLEYPANFDKPHDFTFIGNYRFSHRFSVSFNLVYSTGRPITLPIGLYDYGGSERVLYSERNQYRIPDYFRTDLSMNIEGNHKVKQLTHNSWTLGVYNLLGRRNAYSVYFTAENGRIKGYKLSIFGSAIPFVTYNIRF